MLSGLDYDLYSLGRVVEVGSLSARTKIATKVFVRRVFAIFATNASFSCVIANLQINFSMICNKYHVIVHFLSKKHCFDPKEQIFLAKSLPKSALITTKLNIATK